MPSPTPTFDDDRPNVGTDDDTIEDTVTDPGASIAGAPDSRPPNYLVRRAAVVGGVVLSSPSPRCWSDG